MSENTARELLVDICELLIKKVSDLEVRIVKLEESK